MQHAFICNLVIILFVNSKTIGNSNTYNGMAFMAVSVIATGMLCILHSAYTMYIFDNYVKFSILALYNLPNAKHI